MSSEHLNAVRKFFQENYIQPFSFWAKYFGSRTKAEPQDEQVLIDGGYHWDENDQVYKGSRSGEEMVAFPNHQFIWLWGGIGKHLKNPEKLAIWVGGRVEKFITAFYTLSGASLAASGGEDINFTGTGERPTPVDTTPMDPTDKLIAQLKHQAGKDKKLPADVMIDVGQKAKQENNEKLLAFLKTITPIMENKVKISKLNELIRHIVNTILNEEDDIDEMTGSAAAGPVSTPFAFKKVKEADTDELKEMTTTGNVAGYQIPGAFAKQGGSKKGLNVSKNLGFELTPQGEKEMERRADKLREGSK